MAIRPLNSVAGFSIGETPNVVIYGNGDITTTNITTSGVANLNSIGNVKISGGTSGQVIQTDGSGTLSFVTIDTWRIQNGTSNVSIASSGGPVTISVSGNANIATFNSTGANITGYLTVDGNISANNYIITPAAKDLILSPATNLVRTNANVNPFSDDAFSLGNNSARWATIYSYDVDLSGNIIVDDTANVGNLRTDNLLHANGTPWDFASAAGSNTWIQYSDGTDLAASANLTYDDSVQELFLNGNFLVANNDPTAGIFVDNIYYANGQPYDFATAAGSNTWIQFSNGIDLDASANLTFDYAARQLYVNGTISATGNANVGNLGATGLHSTTISATGNANIGNIGTGIVTATGNITGGNLVTGGRVTATGNITGGNLITGGTISATGTATVGNVDTSGTVSATGNVVGGNLETLGNIVAVGEASVGSLITSGTVSATGNVVGGNLETLGNIVAVGEASVGSLIVNTTISATGTATVGNVTTSGAVSATGNVTGGNVVTGGVVSATGNVTAGNVVTSGRVSATGNVVGGNISTAGTISSTGTATLGNVQTTGSISSTGTATVGNLATGGNVSASGNVTAGMVVYAGNLSVTNSVISDLIPDTSNTYNLGSSSFRWNNIYAANFVGNISGNISAPGLNTEIIFNDSGTANAVANFTYDKTFNSGGGLLNVGNTAGGEITTDYLYAAYANVNGNIDTTGDINATGNVSAHDITASGNITTTGTGGDITMTGGDITGVNDISANTANFTGLVTADNLTVNLEISGNTANFTGNISALNANLGNLATANYINVANDIHVIGNVDAANFVGPLSNGTSQVKVYNTANVEISVDGTTNAASFTTTGLRVTGNITSSAGNILSNGNVTANSFVNAANANVTGQVEAGSVLTATITAPAGNITISAADTNKSILLVPTGTGTVDVASKKITSLATPVDDTDAATKAYVDSVAQGLDIKASVAYATASALPAYTYNNGTSGVGATITANANGALSIDGGSPTVGDRVLVKNETSTNAPYNGIYVVTATGGAGAPFVLTRATDFDNGSPSGEIPGAFTFVELGSTNEDTGWVCTTNAPVIVGTTPISFAQFSGAGSYTAGPGLTLTGSQFSVNTDGETTEISGGNVVVKANANLTTPNIGDATFSSITWNNLSNGNISSNNLNTSNSANIGLDLFVTGEAQVNGNISSNSWVNAANVFVSTDVSAQGNVVAGNVTANATIFATDAQLTNSVVTNELTVNNNITGNTANFSGLVTLFNGLDACVGNINGSNASFSANVTVGNLVINSHTTGNTANFSGLVTVESLDVNTSISGNTANFTGNISALNANLGNLATANYFTGTLVKGTSNVSIPTSDGNVNITSGGNLTLVVTDTSANITGDLNVSGNFNVGSLEAANIKADTSVLVGNTTITWANVTTSSISANQTISSFSVTGVTGVEWLVKAVDASGSKYSVATVTAVTDGTSADYSTFGTVQLGGYTGSLAVNIVGSTIRLQVTPSSSNATVWTTQYRLI